MKKLNYFWKWLIPIRPNGNPSFQLSNLYIPAFQRILY